MPETAICRQCKNYVPEDRQATGTYRSEDGTVVCRECQSMDSWADFGG